MTIAGAGLVVSCGGKQGSPAPDLPARELFYGAAMPPDRLAGFEAEIGSRLSCHRSFFEAGHESDLVAQARSDVRLGRVPLVSIKPSGSWSAAAQETAWLDRLVEPLAEVPAPVFLIVHHEPENDVASYGSPADYVAMQRAALDRAERAGSNVSVVPVLSSWSFSPSASRRRPTDWNVDEAPVYGLDLYNPWSPTNGKNWVPFEDRLALATQEAQGRPLLIGEYGCRSDPSQPGRAAGWLLDAFASALSEGVIAMAYFNSSRNTRDETWELDVETLPVFTELLNQKEVAHL